MSYYVEDKPALKQFTGWTGPIGRDLHRRLRTLQYRAKGSVGTRYATGELRRDIEIRHRTVVDGLQGEVGSWHTDHAAAHHEGARPHMIYPRADNPIQRLVFRVNGRLVFAKKVSHPGNRPNPFLTRWLREAVR